MKRFIPLTTWLVALLIIAGALLMFESDFLWKLQDQNLFLNTKLFFNEQMVVPGGLLSWMGTYLTQYFYYPWLGTVLLSLCWLLMMWFTKRAFKLSNQWSALTLVPVALLLLTIVDMGYWVYILKLPGHVFVGTLGTTAVAGLLWAFRALPQRFGLRLIFIVITALLGYPFLGIYGLGTTLLMGLFIWNLEQPLWQKSYMVFTMAKYGYFHIWHHDADLWVLDLTSGEAKPITAINSNDTESYHTWSSNGHWLVFSSRRDDGTYTRPFFAHMDKDGKWGKPFELPQADPDYHRQFLRSYNIPELMKGPVEIAPQTFADVLKGDGEPVKYVQRLSK